jgi:hypothetical protein
MATQFNGPGSYLANSAISIHRAVSISANLGVGLNPDTALPFGFAERDVVSGDFVTVKFPNDGGTFNASVTVAPVTVGNTLYAAANGQVSTTGTVTVGRALSNAATNGAIIEIQVVSKVA